MEGTKAGELENKAQNSWVWLSVQLATKESWTQWGVALLCQADSLEACRAHAHYGTSSVVQNNGIQHVLVQNPPSHLSPLGERRLGAGYGVNSAARRQKTDLNASQSLSY